MSGPGLRVTFRTGLGGGVLAIGPSSSKSLGSPKIRSLASWYFFLHSTGVWGTGEGETEEIFKGVVIGVGCPSILIGAWMIVGGSGPTVAEVDDLENHGL